MSSPFKIFVLLFSTILLLIAVIFAFPGGELKITENFSLHFFSKSSLLHPGGTTTVDISEIITGQGELDSDSTNVATIDSAMIDSIALNPAEIVLVKNKISFPEGNDSSMNSFFEALDEVANGGAAIRILHYGDSQMEGDRITSVIRQKFAENSRFGNCGTGLLPVRDLIQGRLAVRQTQSSNWQKYSVFEKNTDKPPYKDYGLNGTFFRFSPFPPADTIALDSTLLDIPIKDSVPPGPQVYKAWLNIKGSAGGQAATRNADVFRLYYNHLEKPLALAICFNGGDTLHEMLQPEPGFHFRQWPLGGKFSSAYLHFEAEQSPDIYGVSLDCRTGVQVDNIGMRGSAVANFTGMNPGNLSRQFSALNVKLVIMQFGVNVVPHVIEDYTYYERMYFGQLKALKASNPNLAILVIGVSDMAQKDGLNMVSYPNIEKIRNAQKNAAFKAGVPFWDLYEAMGGKNAMVSWVENDPPYAEKDYTHFNPTGARVIGKMIYDAILESYYVYKKIINP